MEKKILVLLILFFSNCNSFKKNELSTFENLIDKNKNLSNFLYDYIKKEKKEIYEITITEELNIYKIQIIKCNKPSITYGKYFEIDSINNYPVVIYETKKLDKKYDRKLHEKMYQNVINDSIIDVNGRFFFDGCPYGYTFIVCKNNLEKSMIIQPKDYYKINSPSIEKMVKTLCDK